MEVVTFHYTGLFDCYCFKYNVVSDIHLPKSYHLSAHIVIPYVSMYCGRRLIFTCWLHITESHIITQASIQLQAYGLC